MMIVDDDSILPSSTSAFNHNSYAIRDGLVVLACLPSTINICVAQTLAAGADMGTAIFNAIFGNVIGVFVTPILSLWLLGGGEGGISLLSTLNKLGGVVIFPLILGEVMMVMIVMMRIVEIVTDYNYLSTIIYHPLIHNHVPAINIYIHHPSLPPLYYPSSPSITSLHHPSIYHLQVNWRGRLRLVGSSGASPNTPGP